MKTTRHLQSPAANDRQALAQNPFPDALAGFALSREKMADYLQQDYLCVEGVVRYFGADVAHATKLANAVPGAQFSALICEHESTYLALAGLAVAR